MGRALGVIAVLLVVLPPASVAGGLLILAMLAILNNIMGP